MNWLLTDDGTRVALIIAFSFYPVAWLLKRWEEKLKDKSIGSDKTKP